jgi:hypothetical protein
LSLNKRKSSIKYFKAKKLFYINNVSYCDLLKQKPNGETYISASLTTLAKRQLINAECREGKENIRYIIISSDIEAVINNLFQIQDLETIKNNFADIESVILTKLKRQVVKKSKIDFFNLNLYFRSNVPKVQVLLFRIKVLLLLIGWI